MTVTRSIGREVLLLVAAGTVVQLLMPFRHDLPAHVVGGGAAALLAVAVAPRRAVAAMGGAVIAYSVGLVVALAWLTEHLVFGPFDLVDVAFTAAGALVVADTDGTVAITSSTDRIRWVGAGTALIGTALLFRYGLAGGG